VRKVDLGKGLVVLKHGEIANLGMPPMTMGFNVANKKMLKGLKVGQKVKFQAEIVDGKATVTELQHIR
jgi:Cu/Ag efflux protein CusF